MEQNPHQGGGPDRLTATPRWPKYLGALALDTWLRRVAAYDSEEPSVALFIAQYPGEEAGQPAVEVHGDDSFQLPLHLQWGDESVPTDLCERPLNPEDTAAVRRILTMAVNIFAGRTAPFALYTQLEPRTYAALATRLSTGTRLPARAELTSVRGQYVAKGVIARLERTRRLWMGTELRLV